MAVSAGALVNRSCDLEGGSVKLAQLGRTAIPGMLMLLFAALEQENEVDPGLRAAIERLSTIQTLFDAEGRPASGKVLGVILDALESIRTGIS